ncbi:sensor histidine kinase [Arcobacter arenosus]|uniref:histidine kinase n=1 Tax=Arcobacter arenosus TaxID=2576037 RepID=A0A5R8Y4U3_9BACT|nr:sensor histidine kinase [Arcobacter arenosus]TLP41086.1 sensor histidine kinase [Arcobacter arenosus]
MKNIQSIKSRLLISLTLPLTIGAILLVLVIYFIVQDKVNKHFDNTLYATAKSMEDSINIKNGRLIVNLPYFAIDLLASNSDGLVFYSIVNEKKKVLTGYKNLLRDDLLANNDKLFYYTTYAGARLRVVSFKTSLASAGKVHFATITIGETLEGRETTINEILTILFIVILSVIIFTLLVSFFAVKNGLLPLYKLKQIIQKRDSKDLKPIHFDAPKEIEDVVNSINILLTRSRDTIKYIEQFNSDVSHQLRTPLAELKVQLEEYHENNNWDYVELNKVVNTMSHITEQLLLYAKTNPSTIDKTYLKRINLNSFCKEYALKVSSKVYSKGFEFAFEDIDEDIFIEADEIMLRSMLDNILNNALHYALDDFGNPIGTITLFLKRHNNTIWLSIKDEGKGINKKDLNTIFDRFYRVDSKKSGSGLGLNIVKQIASLHRAKVEAINNNGLVVSIIFPLK